MTRSAAIARRTRPFSGRSGRKAIALDRTAPDASLVALAVADRAGVDDHEVARIDRGGDVDRVRAFGPAILAIRWGTTMVSLALAGPYFARGDLWVVLWAGVIAGYTVLRTVKPLRYFGDTRSLLRVLAEVGLHTVAVASTGYWDSPFFFSLVSAIVVAGFARGFSFALRIAAVSALAVAVPGLTRSDFGDGDARTAVQWVVILAMVALIAGYARRISGEADRQHSLALDRLGHLADANALLFSLHRVAQTLPASLDLDEVLDSTLGRLHGLFDFSAVAILVLEDSDATWIVSRREGVRLPPRIDPDDLPPPIRLAIAEERPVSLPNLLTTGGPGLEPSKASGLYAPLRARGSIIGLLSIEHEDDHHFTPRDTELMTGFVEPVALAIDNARWFARLRTVGADEERTRIARDLHDRIGQSLAYLAFELDRIVRHANQDPAVNEELGRLRQDVRGVIGEVRDTLHDLRTDVSEQQDIATTLEAFAARIEDRNHGLRISLRCDQEARLPILQEREMWRIAQEALTNVGRHAGAEQVSVVWRCDNETAALEVVDDGVGFAVDATDTTDRYGLLGMRERASSIGATLEISSVEGRGTKVRCHLPRA